MGNITAPPFLIFTLLILVGGTPPGALGKMIIFKHLSKVKCPKFPFVTGGLKMIIRRKLPTYRDKIFSRGDAGNSSIYGRNTLRRIAVSSVNLYRYQSTLSHYQYTLCRLDMM